MSTPPPLPQAINIHHDVIREVLAEHGAYEVKTIGDAFMIGCHTATQMADVATDIQRRLNACEWPLRVALDARGNGQDPALWNGLRVRIGMHWGEPTVYMDPAVGSVDYYGSTVNCASRVEAVGAGGQVVCTAQTFEQVQRELNGELLNKKYSFEPLKQVRLRGISGLVDIFQVCHGTRRRGAHWGFAQGGGITNSRLRGGGAMACQGAMCRLQANFDF